MANIDYEEQMAQIEEEKQDRLTDMEEMYSGMVEQSKQTYDDLIGASKDWVTEQSALQQQQTDFTIDQINQQKEQTQKDYTKEQSGAYADWQKESNRYGAGAEEQAAAGLSNSGYSESSQVQMYNNYQNRVAAARQSYNLAVMNYNNAIKEAQLQNSSALAEIAYTGLQQQLELALQSLQYKNQLLLDLEGQKAQIEDTYHNRYLDVLNQMNTDRAFEESVRQYNQDYEEGVRQFDLEMERLKTLDEEEKRQFDLMYGQSGAYIVKDDETAKQAEETGASVARSDIAGRIMNGYYPGITATNKENAEFIEKNMPPSGISVQKINTNAASKEIDLYSLGLPGSDAIQKLYNATGPLGKTVMDYNYNVIENAAGKMSYAVATDYYRGELNPDAETYGTFKNGYQPKGISGHGTLEKTGETTTIERTVMYGTKKGKKVELTQNIWEAEDGTRWIWDGKNNCYVPEI